MIDAPYILISMTPAILSSIGTSIGQGFIGKQALISMHQQPESSDVISKTSIIGIAITESASIMGLIISILLIRDHSKLPYNEFTIFGLIAIAFSVGISGLCAGIAASFPATASCASLARQPFQKTKILNLMLITQTLIMTPNMFGLIVALMIKNNLATIDGFNIAMQLLSAGISIGLGCIGPSIGLSLFAFAACEAIGINKKAYSKIITFTFICEAIIETPIIFSLLISLMILTTTTNVSSLVQGWQFLAAALCISLSTISPGINSGRTGAAACKKIGTNLELYSTISKMAMLGLAMIDTFAIYGLLLSILMLLY